ncbi:MAG: hypothetical protein Kow0092_02820 [Deferrisomatales bacterium]
MDVCVGRGSVEGGWAVRLSCGLTRRLLAAAVGGLLAAGAAAQEGEPSPFERDLVKYRSFFDYGGFEPELDSLLPEGYVSQWRTSVGLSGTYTDNVDKESPARDAFWTDGVFGLGWLRKAPRWDADVNYRLSATLYETRYADRGNFTHRAAGTVRWQAGPHLDLNAGAHFAQDLEEGLDSVLRGVRSTYDNRSDEYGAHARYRWQASRSVESSGGYRVSYRDYASESADGDDTLRQSLDEQLSWGISARDALGLRYGLSLEEEKDPTEKRWIHQGGVSWTHTFLTFPENRRSSLRLAYNVERALFDEDEASGEDSDYWDHSGSARYAFAWSPRTDVGLSAGAQWIAPDEDADEKSWTAGADLAHRFSEYTSGTLSASRRLAYLPEERRARSAWSFAGGLHHRFGRYTEGSLNASQAWDYQPASTTSDVTVLTQTRSATASLRSRLSERVRMNLGGSYLWGDPGESLGGDGDDKYRQWGGNGGLTLSVQRTGLVGLSYQALRRRSDDPDDDYLLHVARLFASGRLADWLDARVAYTYENRDYKKDAGNDDYRDNRVTFGLNGAW